MKPILLLILDGLGLNPNPKANAVTAASTPNLDKLMKFYPNSTLITHGERVGLPSGQMGNSEVGHLNIGAGRVVMQDLSRINQAMNKGKILDSPAGKNLIENAKSSSLHLIGLTSFGGVHSNASHLISIARNAAEQGVKKIYLHAISDGRDCPPTAAAEDLTKIEEELSQVASDYKAEVRIVDLCGRYFAMDRDKRWDRTEKYWKLITTGQGSQEENPEHALKSQYKLDKTDEFIEPAVFPNHVPVSNKDSVLMFNFRADRVRQLSEVFLSGEAFEGFKNQSPLKPKFLASLTEYDEDFNMPVVFPPQQIVNHLGHALEQAGLSQLRLAETEKYPHVTYFLSGGVETELQGEQRQMVASPRDVATYDLKPEMSVFQITEKLISALESGNTDVAIVNFANCDMVGHTGVFEAAVKAVEAVDQCLGEVLSALENVDGQAIITADHGNSEQMVDYETGEPHTFHTTYPVPVVWFGPEVEGKSLRSGGALCDLAPTVCKLAGIPVPKEMTGESLV